VAGALGGDAALQADGYNFTKFASDASSRIVSAGVRAAMGGRFEIKEVAADVFGNAIANSIVDTVAASGVDRRRQEAYDRQSMADFLANFGHGRASAPKLFGEFDKQMSDLDASLEQTRKTMAGFGNDPGDGPVKGGLFDD